MVMTGARNYVDVPAPAVAKGGILSVANVVDVSDPHDLLGAEYVTDACAEAYTWDEFCTLAGIVCPPTASVTGEKQFNDSLDLVVGDPFAIYAGVTCTLIELEEARRRAERALAYNERRLLDRRLNTWLLSNSFNLLAGATNPLDDIAVAIGVLENYIANTYGGVGIIAMSIEAANAAAAAHVLESNDLTHELHTVLGTPVAALATPLFERPMSIYALGQTTLLRGTTSTYSVPGHNDCNGRWVPLRALAERIYVPLIECIAGRVDVTGFGVPDMLPDPFAPTLGSIVPTSAAITGPPFTLRAAGTFTVDSVIEIDGDIQRTTYHSDAELSCVVDPTSYPAGTVQVTVRNGPASSAPQTFTFTP